MKPSHYRTPRTMQECHFMEPDGIETRKGEILKIKAQQNEDAAHRAIYVLIAVAVLLMWWRLA